jgi:hypothetical protein
MGRLAKIEMELGSRAWCHVRNQESEFIIGEVDALTFGWSKVPSVGGSFVR